MKKPSPRKAKLKEKRQLSDSEESETKEKPKKKSSRIVYSDDDSFVNVNHQIGEVPFGDLTTNEILAIGNQPRVR
jgi:hypothetical protein